ncbi:MAG: fumarylacetoacetate hydrolase family protein [Verrucomicrobia bacterium]|nr:fumarylacetoacetate hydrolase family protein [Kiritimatiellia bacterium]MCP5489136.1 fumarylacetoacetate hydrolase family protein [Verrucomicrobiota bacterium]
MKLVRFGQPGRERPGVFLDQAPELDGQPGILDVRAMAFDLCDYDRFFFEHHGLDRVRALLAESRRNILPASRVRLGAPVAPPGQLICAGKNYADHAREFDTEIPTRPILFGKAVGSILGPADPIPLPAHITRADYEAELAVVIGTTCREVKEEHALAVIAGYTLINDITDREEQRATSQWYLGKSPDGFCPMGPCLCTPDICPAPDQFQLRLTLNGEILQQGQTQDMIFSIATLIAFITRSMTLYAGDVLATGTPSGVGFARTPPVFLKRGDRVEVDCSPIGQLSNPVG